MGAFAEFREAIIALVKGQMKDPTLQCTVKAVDKNNKTITAYSERDKVDYFKIRLMSLSGDQLTDGITAFPKEGSTVMISMIEGVDTMYYVSQYGEIESYEIKIGTIKFYIDKDEIKFNDGSLGGLIKIQELVDDVNSIKSDINDLKTAFAAWVTVPNDGGAALKAVLATYFSSMLVPLNKVTIENTKVKH